MKTVLEHTHTHRQCANNCFSLSHFWTDYRTSTHNEKQLEQDSKYQHIVKRLPGPSAQDFCQFKYSTLPHSTDGQTDRHTKISGERKHLQWTTQGPTSGSSTPDLRTSYKKLRKMSAVFGTPKSGHCVYWKCKTVLDSSSCVERKDEECGYKEWKWFCDVAMLAKLAHTSVLVRERWESL